MFFSFHSVEVLVLFTLKLSNLSRCRIFFLLLIYHYLVHDIFYMLNRVIFCRVVLLLFQVSILPIPLNAYLLSFVKFNDVFCTYKNFQILYVDYSMTVSIFFAGCVFCLNEDYSHWGNFYSGFHVSELTSFLRWP